MYCRRNFTKISISSYFVRYVSSKPVNAPNIMDRPPCHNFISTLLGINPKRCSKMLGQNEKLLNVSRKDLINSFELLKSCNFSAQDIESKPMILYINSITLSNRYIALQECGCRQINLSTLFKFLIVTNKDIATLKLYGIIPRDVDVQHSLEQVFVSDIEIKLNEKLSEEHLLKTFRENILNLYLVEKLHFSKTELERQWKTYGRIRHKSFKSIIQMINILIEELHFPVERIIKNGYLLYGDPDNLKKMINEIRQIGGENFKEILYRRPKIIMSSFESVSNTIKHVQNFGLSESAILKCLEILTLGSQTVLERLNEIRVTSELQPYISNPRILRLVHYQNKVMQRLEYLNNMKVKCASLHILSCHSDAFVRYAREGTDRNKGKDVILYLAKSFNVSQSKVRTVLQRHPNWCHIPILQVKECLEFLLKNYFSLKDVLGNIHILLYPKYKIQEKLKILQTDEFYKEMQLDTKYAYVPHDKILTLCLYLIESEFHFTGDGIWTDHNTDNVENFNNFIPEFLENNKKAYKYGGKPSSRIIQSEVVI